MPSPSRHGQDGAGAASRDGYTSWHESGLGTCAVAVHLGAREMCTKPVTTDDPIGCIRCDGSRFDNTKDTR
jgi:hypothetical protein